MLQTYTMTWTKGDTASWTRTGKNPAAQLAVPIVPSIYPDLTAWSKTDGRPFLMKQSAGGNEPNCVHPCPCGFNGDAVKPCTCAPAIVTKYQKRISGPLLDRIDIHIEVPRVDYEKLSGDRLGESESIRTPVQAARDIQTKRFSNYTSYPVSGDIALPTLIISAILAVLTLLLYVVTKSRFQRTRLIFNE